MLSLPEECIDILPPLHQQDCPDKERAMRLHASILACGAALLLALLAAWPAISMSPFPVPGFRNAPAGPALNLLTVAAAGFAVWVLAFWEHARRHQLLFAVVASTCFLHAALFVSVAVGMGFALLAVLVRSK